MKQYDFQTTVTGVAYGCITVPDNTPEKQVIEMIQNIPKKDKSIDYYVDNINITSIDKDSIIIKEENEEVH